MATEGKWLQLQEGVEPAFDTEVIFMRTLGLMNMMDFDLRKLFDYELYQIPTSLFIDVANLRQSTTQSKLKKSIEVEQSFQTMSDPLVLVLDGCAILWTIHRPISGMVDDLITAIKIYLRQKLAMCDVYQLRTTKYKSFR